MVVQTISNVLAAGRWRGSVDPLERVREIEARAERVEAEYARREEEKRWAVVEKARWEILSIGRAEYLPAEESSAEVWEQARKNAWRKHLGNWHYNPKALERDAAVCKKLHEKRLERERKKLELWSETHEVEDGIAEGL